MEELTNSQENSRTRTLHMLPFCCIVWRSERSDKLAVAGLQYSGSSITNVPIQIPRVPISGIFEKVEDTLQENKWTW